MKKLILLMILGFFALGVEAQTGCISGNCTEGYGTFKWSTGEIYVGYWQGGKRYGEGTNLFADGTRYSGMWLNDKRNGYGENFYIDGTTKAGFWNLDVFKGVNSNPFSTSKQTGCIYGDCTNGYGTYLWEDGERYVGDWLNDARNGHGINYYTNGDRFDGQWRDDYKEGNGTYYYADGTFESGTWVEGEKVNGGNYNPFAVETEEYGCMEGDCYNGYGVYTWDSGAKYEGNWKNGDYFGQGTYYYANGDVYKGNFVASKRNGFGEYTFSVDKRVYKGEWMNDAYNGQGTMYYADGTTKSGIWANNAYVGPSNVNTAPTVSWISPNNGFTSALNTTTIKMCVKSASVPEKIEIYVNNQLQISDLARGYSVVDANCDYNIERTITLSPGANSVKIAVKNAGGTTTSDIRTITYNAPEQNNVTQEKRLALVIGNSAYTSSPLRNPANDAVAMARELENLGFEVMLYTDLGHDEMIRNIRTFGEKLSTNRGVGLFYYAGHGVQLGGDNYLVPIDAEIAKEQDVELEAVNLKRVLGEMDFARNNMNIVILDACRNNPFVRSFRSASNGLATTTAPQGTFIAFATSPGSVAADGEGNNGLYTQELIQAMRVPGAKIEDVFKTVRNNVYTKSNQQQVPWENSSIFGDFYFKK